MNSRFDSFLMFFNIKTKTIVCWLDGAKDDCKCWDGFRKNTKIVVAVFVCIHPDGLNAQLYKMSDKRKNWKSIKWQHISIRRPLIADRCSGLCSWSCGLNIVHVYFTWLNTTWAWLVSLLICTVALAHTVKVIMCIYLFSSNELFHFNYLFFFSLSV